MAILGLDIGKKRVGLAIVLENIVFPVKVISRAKLFPELKKIVVQKNIHTIVVGLPKGEYTGISQLQNNQNLLQVIQNTFPDIQVVGEDERYTTKIAQSVLDEVGQQGEKDDIAACIILESYIKRLNK